MTKNQGILVVDDDAKTRHILELNLRNKYRVFLAGSGREALTVLKSEPVHLILSDLRMPDIDGMSLLKTVRTADPEIPFIIMTAYGTVGNAVAALKQGADDYILKPVKIDEIELMIGKALSHADLQRENRRLREALRRSGGTQEFITANLRMQAILKKVEQVAPSLATVLITGESGTGKELIAQAVHRLSPRAAKPCVHINCAAIPHDLLESELFGHEKGSFTGAISQKHGKLEDADGGTLHLDEIGELPVPLQVKLLRVLETGQFSRVSGNKTLQADFRIIASTNRNLKDAIRDGTFRADLFYRLNVVSIELPPLRERKDDIPVLVRHFLFKHASRMHKSVQKVEPAALDLLCRYDWPGNVRELENVVLQALVLTDETMIRARHLPQDIRANAARLTTGEIPGNKQELLAARARACAAIERRFLETALAKYKGNISLTAKETGFSRRNLQIMMRKCGLQPM